MSETLSFITEATSLVLLKNDPRYDIIVSEVVEEGESSIGPDDTDANLESFPYLFDIFMNLLESEKLLLE